MAQKKQYYFVQYQYKGRTYYKNQDGKKVSAAKVKAGKRKVYLQYKSGEFKGQLIDRRQKKSSTFKTPPPRKAKIFSVANVYLVSNASFAIESNAAIFITAEQTDHELVSNEARNKLVLFFYRMGDLFYKIFRKEVEEISLARFFIGEGRGIKDNFWIWDIDYLEIDNEDKFMEDDEIAPKIERFKKEVFSLFDQYFR